MGYVASVLHLTFDTEDTLRRVRADRAADRATARRLMEEMDGPAGVRNDLVEKIRAQIDAGEYDVESKLDLVVDRLAEDL